MKASRSFYESDVLCVFVFWQREKPIETGNVGSVYTIYVVARVYRRFDSSRPSFTTFMPKGQTGCDGCSESNIKFLSQWGRKACRTIQDQSKSHGRTQITFFIQKKCYRVSWDKRASTKIRLGFLWIKIMAPGEKQWQNGGEFGHNHTTAAGSGIAFLARLREGKRAQR